MRHFIDRVLRIEEYEIEVTQEKEGIEISITGKEDPQGFTLKLTNDLAIVLGSLIESSGRENNNLNYMNSQFCAMERVSNQGFLR